MPNKRFPFMTWLLKTIEIAAGATWCPKAPRETRLTLHRLCEFYKGPSAARQPQLHSAGSPSETDFSGVQRE